jgi:DNA-binding transcriptional ArsR family regulator
MAELEAMIETCPEDRREALRALAEETRARQLRNDDNIARARAGVETLRVTEELAALNFEMVREAAGRLRGLHG